MVGDDLYSGAQVTSWSSPTTGVTVQLSTGYGDVTWSVNALAAGQSVVINYNVLVTEYIL